MAFRVARATVRAAVLLAWLPAGAFAQGEPLREGRTARLHVRGLVAPVEGTVVAVEPDGVRIATNQGELRLGMAQIERPEVLGSRGNTRRGAVIGFGVGLAVGVILVVQAKDDCVPQALQVCGPEGDRFQERRLAIPPVVGAALGAVIGSRIRTPTWVPAFIPLVDRPDGLALGLAWRLPT